MNDRSPPNHPEIIELLPDYAVGALEDGDLWRVAAHLDTCAICQRELTFILETVTLLGEAPLPHASVKTAVLARVASPPLAPVSTAPPAHVRRFPAAAAALALVAAVALIAAVFAVWTYVLADDQSENDLVASLLLDPDAAHAINDSELDVGAGGAMFTDDSSDVAFLVASGLPLPGPEQRYQIWLFKESGERISAGFVPVDSDGVGQAVVRAPEEFAAYWAVGVSLEPAAGSDAPTTPLVVGGWLR